MKNTKLLHWGLYAMLTTVIMGSCKKDSSEGSQILSASIKNPSQTISENVGSVSVIINLSAATSRTLSLNYSFSGTAILNGDYEYDSTSTIVIPMGSTTAELKFTIFNDHVLESDKTIQVKLSSDGIANFINNEATITIQDNDVSRALTGLVTDLLWDGGSPVDLNLFAFTNVVIINEELVSAQVVDGSGGEKGFESVYISNGNPDGDYYLMVDYYSGSRNVNFTLNAYGPEIPIAMENDSFGGGDVGSFYLYGPIHKSGSKYNSRSATIINLRR